MRRLQPQQTQSEARSEKTALWSRREPSARESHNYYSEYTAKCQELSSSIGTKSSRKIPKKWNGMQPARAQILRRTFVSPEFGGSARCGWRHDLPLDDQILHTDPAALSMNPAVSVIDYNVSRHEIYLDICCLRVASHPAGAGVSVARFWR
jgi:hypothetical protein